MLQILTTARWYAVGFAVSLTVHAGAYALLRSAPVSERSEIGPTLVEFSVPPPAAPPPEAPEKVDTEPVEHADSVEPEPALVRADLPEPEAETAPEASPPDEPVALTGVTLTNAGSGEGWNAPVGNGESRRGPLRQPTTRRAAPKPREPLRRASRRRPKSQAPPVVPVADLSRPPEPPPLSGKLVSNYPSAARRRGEEGTAVVSARIDPDGTIRVASVAHESGAGFGAACRRTVLGSVWSPPIDAAGRPVATRIAYTCRFRVDRR
jgi:protein TonB